MSLAGMCPHCLWALPAGFSLPGRKGSHGLTAEETCLVGELLLLTGPGDLVEMWGFASHFWIKAAMAYVSRDQPGLEHPRANMEEQPSVVNGPSCREEMDRCLKAGSMQQHEISRPAWLLPLQLQKSDIHFRKMEGPTAHHKSQDLKSEGSQPGKETATEKGLPVKVAQTLQGATESDFPSWQLQKTCDVRLLVFPSYETHPSWTGLTKGRKMLWSRLS